MILHSKIIGDGTPLIILHGFLGMSDNWKTLGNRFAEQGFQVHLVDQRNHGRSFHASEFNYTVMAEDLLAYADHYGIEQTSIIGHSMGGKTAMLFAVHNEFRVDKLLVADISPKYYPTHHEDILNGLNSLDFDVIRSRGEADKELANYLSDIGTRMFLLKNLYWEQKTRLGFRMNLPILTEEVEEVGEALQQGTSFDGNTLFVKGGRSSYIKNEDRLLIQAHFPKAEVVEMPKVGHWVHAEDPKLFFEIATNFLNS